MTERNRLVDLDPREFSLVDRPAIGRKALVIKNEDGTIEGGLTMLTPEEIAAAAAAGKPVDPAAQPPQQPDDPTKKAGTNTQAIQEIEAMMANPNLDPAAKEQLGKILDLMKTPAAPPPPKPADPPAAEPPMHKEFNPDEMVATVVQQMAAEDGPVAKMIAAAIHKNDETLLTKVGEVVATQLAGVTKRIDGIDQVFGVSKRLKADEATIAKRDAATTVSEAFFPGAIGAVFSNLGK
jgi:hypothetical protein